MEIPEVPVYGCSNLQSTSGEQMALCSFAHQLGSCNFSSELGIGDDTREDATLLMSLLSKNPDKKDMSSSDSSCSSESSSGSKRGVFNFTCPSLSLELSNHNRAISTHLEHKSSVPRRISNENGNSTVAETSTTEETVLPATLLRRPLKVDDRDALRLSADAMARNIHLSYQKAIDWRVNSWIEALSKMLVSKEREMLAEGAAKDDLKSLLHTREARLIVALRGVHKKISVTGTGTSFRVLPDRLEDDAEGSPSGSKRRRLDAECTSKIEETDSYLYSVTHALILECTINMETPAGHSEVTLEIPGTIEGVFLSVEFNREEMKSVVVGLNTEILSAMIEKSCRKVVRACAEVVVREIQVEPPDSSDRAPSETSVSDDECASAALTPARPSCSSPEGVFATIVTPQSLFSPSCVKQLSPPSDSVIMPIPDDLHVTTLKPRRISPQPGSPAFGSVSSLFTPQTPKKSHRDEGLALISPPPNDSQEYHEVPENGPSLPVLVEVACRAMQAK